MRLIANDELTAVVGGDNKVVTTAPYQIRDVPGGSLSASDAAARAAQPTDGPNRETRSSTLKDVIKEIKSTAGADVAVDCKIHVDNQNDRVNWTVDCNARLSAGAGGRRASQ